MTTPRIAIIGAGPAGCMLARILSLSQIPVTIFESDSSPDYRSQGGTLDLHPDTGLLAIKAAKLWDEYTALARFDGDHMLICDKDLNRYLEVGASNDASGRPEIDRADLRRILAESLPEGTIRWGHRLQRVENGGRLVFESSTESGFDLIVGCEGAWSKVRSSITSVQPHYAGIGYQRFSIPEARETAPELAKMVKGGNIFAHANGKQFSVQQMGDGSLQVSFAAVRPEDWMQTCGFDPHDLAQTKKAVLAELHDWCPQLREAVEKAQGPCYPNRLYMLPVGWRWEHRRGTTIIGDAAHVMCPFAGEGVNVAFDDARKLADAIIEAVQTHQEKKDGGSSFAAQLDRRVEAFELDMFRRMEVVQRQTYELTQLWFFTPGDQRRVVPKVLLAHMKPSVPGVLFPVASVLLHAWWFVWTRLLGRAGFKF
ncbi:hypothetical protein F4778DRAFT_192869 [Xylariomycetidae sp. FL2044]|nr:hypothetical protein F4778DRAFT_192869 [Xylariomycetidae sp. FL2044]